MLCPRCESDDVESVSSSYGKNRWYCFKCNKMFEGKSSKYRNKPTMVDGKRFASKAEAKYYVGLLARFMAGEVKIIIRQPSIDLPGNIKYRADFLIVLDDGSVDIIDVKGFITKEFKLKAKLFKSKYPGVNFYLETKKGRKQI